MVQQVKMHASKFGNLSLNAGTHLMDGENQLSSDLHTYCGGKKQQPPNKPVCVWF